MLSRNAVVPWFGSVSHGDERIGERGTVRSLCEPGLGRGLLLEARMIMISRLECVEKVQPLYQDYLEYMRGFFEIDSYDSWYERAMAYLQLYAMEDDRFIYSLKESENIIGFAFVNKTTQTGYRKSFLCIEFEMVCSCLSNF